jgi:fumarylacetoacetase
MIGLVFPDLFNLVDLARDVQGFESKPLGPFLGKSFATSISPWVITPEALEPARVPQMPRRYELLPHLTPKVAKPTVDINLAVSLKGSNHSFTKPE